MEGREGKRGRGEDEVRRVRKAQGWSRSPLAGHCPAATDVIAICVTPDLLLKHADEAFATYAWRQIKHFEK
jgi:hypothetical protein